MSTDSTAKPDTGGAFGRFEILGVLVVAAMVRLHGLGSRSVWLDEGFTWTTARASLQELIRICAKEDATPPLSYALTGLFLRLGSSEVTLRMLSCLASIGIVWLTYRLARLFMDRTVSVTAALLAALSPFQVMYAQEARSYTLVAFFLIASTYFFLRAGLEQRRGDWTLYVVALVLGLYTQTIVGLGVLIQAALFVFLPPLRRGIKGWLTALTVALVLYIPWLVAAHSQTQHLAESHWYLDRPGVRDIFHVLRGIAIAPIPLVTSPNEALQPGLEAVMPRSIGQFLLFALPGVPILLGLWAARRSDPAGAMARTGIAGLLAPLGAVIALSWFSPRLLPRFFVFESTFLCLLMAAGLAAMRPGGLATLWTLLLVVMGFYGIERYDVDYTKERWRDAVQFVDVSGMSGRKAALVTFDIDPFAFYNSRLANPMPAFEYSHPEVPFSHAFTPAQLTDMQRRGAANLRDFDEVWVFTRDPKSGTRLEAVKQARTLAAEGRRFVGEWRWDATGGPVRVACWRR